MPESLALQIAPLHELIRVEGWPLVAGSLVQSYGG